jgi:hypothetical protein
MSIYPKIVSTTFRKNIGRNPDTSISISSAEKIVTYYGQKNVSKEKRLIVVKPTLLQHIFYHPFALTYNTRIEIKETTDNTKLIEYKVTHPFPIILSLIFTFIGFIGFANPITYMPLLFLIGYQSFIIFMHNLV